MFINNFILKLIILIIINLQFKYYYCIEHPPYQVSIWMKGQANSNGTHLCNGAIIHERLILTTADCVHSKVFGTNISNPIMNTMITVVAGSLNSPSKSMIIVNVSSIDVAQNFNSTSLQNDLSILHLNESLPLDIRSDIKWIMLDDHHDIKNNTCYINSQSPASPVNIIQQNHPVQIFDNQNCTNSSNYLTSRKNDICSSYVLSSGNICNKTDDDIHSTSDRGTALICDSKLIGLLSYVIPPSQQQTNSNLTCPHVNKLNAIYTRVALYLNWIYGKISTESMIDDSNHTMSPPYAASAPSPTISEIPSGSNLPEYEKKSTSLDPSQSTTTSSTSSDPHSTTTQLHQKSTTSIPQSPQSTMTTTTKPIITSTTHSTNSNIQNKPTIKSTASALSVKLNSFNSMFAVTLILVFSWFHK